MNDTITLTAVAPGVDLSAARWTTSDATVLSLDATAGATIYGARPEGRHRGHRHRGRASKNSVTITVLHSIGNVDLVGPTSLSNGAQATYTATVTDATGRKVSANLTWVASGSVAFVVPDANTGTSIQIRAISVGVGAVTAQAGGRSAQIAVKVSASSGQLVIGGVDGMPLPDTLALGEPLTVAAAYEVTAEPAGDAQWTASGTCTLFGSSGATLSVQETGPGSCTLTASAKGMNATVTFTIVSLTGPGRSPATRAPSRSARCER